MAHQYGQVEVRKSKGKYIVLGTGATNKGVKFIKAFEVIAVQNPADPKFKGAVKAATEKLFDSGE